MSFLRALGRRFVLALQFLTRIPVNVSIDIREGDFPGCAVFFPWVGALIGAMGFVLWYAMDALTGLPYAGAVMGIVTVTMVTGALHLDGLGDTCDGVFSGRSRERALEIMKDSRSGAFGVLGMCLTLIMKTVLMGGVLAECDPLAALLIWMASAMAGRMAIVTAAALGKPARPDGAGRIFLADMGWRQWVPAFLIGTLALAGCMQPLWYVGWALALLAAVVLTGTLSHKLGGLTGDCLGAVNETAEVLFLVAVAAMG